MRTSAFFLLLLLLPCLAALARPVDPGPVVLSYTEYPLTVAGAGYRLVTVVQDMPPETGIAAIPQAAYLLVTVVSGTMTARGGAGERPIASGATWMGGDGSVFLVNAGPAAARVTVSALLPDGAAVAGAVARPEGRR